MKGHIEPGVVPDVLRSIYRGRRTGMLRPEMSLAAELDRTRLAGRLARSNLEASIDRLSVEPGVSAARRDPELIGVLPSGRFREEKAREIREHPVVDHDAPDRGQRDGDIAEQVDQPEAIEAESTNKWELHEEPLGQRLLVVFLPISPDRENLPAFLLDRDNIGKRQFLVLELLRCELFEVPLAVALIDFVIGVLRLLRLRLMLGSWLICDQARLVPVIQWVCPHCQVLEMVAAALEGALITVVSTCLILITLIQVVAAVAPLVVALV